MIFLRDLLNEIVTNTKIICDKCKWSWDIVDGGKNIYVCHKCGHDNKKVNELSPVGNMNAAGPSKVLGKSGKVLGFVADTPNAIATLIQEYPNVQAIEFKMPFSFERKTYKKIKKGDDAWKKLMDRYIDNSTKAILKKDFQLK